MSLRVDFSGVDSSGFDPIPSGTYVAKVTDGELRESGPNSKNPGSQYINWEFTIQEGEYQGRKQWLNTSLLPQALFGLKGLLAATGKFDVDGDLDFDIEDVIGSDVAIVVKTKTYDDELRNEVKKVKPVGESSSDSSLLP